MKIREITEGIDIPKNKWETIMTSDSKLEIGDDLVNLVQAAYGGTEKGSFVNSVQDVLPSDWRVLDWDHKPDVDCTVFFRGARGGEPWTGKKIQGLGHDGERGSKDHAIDQIVKMLGQTGTWIECNGAMRHILKKRGVDMITDERLLQQLFNDPRLQMTGDDEYTRALPNGEQINESVAGRPVLRGQR